MQRPLVRMFLFLAASGLLAASAVRFESVSLSLIVYAAALTCMGIGIYHYIQHAKPRWPGR